MLDIQIEQHGPDGFLLISLRGDANLREVDRLQLELRRASASHPRRAIVDVTEVSFMASLALGTLVEFTSGVKTRGGRVALAGASGMLLDSVRRARLDTLFVMAESVEAAAAEFVRLVPPQADVEGAGVVTDPGRS